MIHYLQHNQIDKQQWDALIEHSPQRQVYVLSWYLNIVSPEWEAMVEVDEDGKYRTAMPLPCRTRLRFKYLQQPLFCQQLGIYGLSEKITTDTYQRLLNEAYTRFRYVINLQFNTNNALLLQLSFPQMQLHATATHYLNLSQDYEQLYDHYTRDRKMNLKRAKRACLEIVESEDLEPLINFFKEETATRIYGGVSESAYTLLRELYRVLQQRGLARLLYTQDSSGRKNAGCLFIVYGNRIVYIFNAAASYGRKLNGRTLMLDYMIREYAGQNYILDFESPDEREQDIVHFYKSFGSKAAIIPVLHYNRLPKAVKLIREARMRFIRKLRGLPNP